MIIVVMGVAGAGKSTIGLLLAAELHWPFYDGDDFHPAFNIEKMKQGRPLTDEDRAPWLEELSKLITGPAESTRSAVIACSALKQRCRKKPVESGPDVRYVYLKGSYDQIHGRLTERQAHFLKAELLESQFQILEEPGEAVIIDITEDPARIVKRIRQALCL